MQCPRCGAEVANAKFCGSCGTPVQAPAAAYQQPYPALMPMPPRRKSLTWLWVTLGVLGFVAVAVIGVLVALGEDDPVVPPVAEQKQSGPGTSVAATGADAAVKSYLEARKAGNLAAAYGMLSSAARSAYTQDEFAAFYGASALTAFGKIEVVKAQDPFYQVMVRDLKSGDTTFAGAPYTVVKEEGKFLVALENPMLDPLDAAFADELYEDAYQLTEQMLEINPFSYFAYYNGGWAEVELGRHQQGLAEFAEAGKYVIAEDKPELVRSVGIVYLRMQQWDQAVASLEEAITLGQAQNAHYRPDWFRQLAADLAVGYEQAGKTGRAIDLLETLYQSDPKGNWARNPPCGWSVSRIRPRTA